jgi:hypothetical protein
MGSLASAATRAGSNGEAIAGGPGGPWSEEAPKRIREKYRESESAAGWRAWQKHLARRKLLAPELLARGRSAPLAWAPALDTEFDPAVRLIKLLRARKLADGRKSKVVRREAESWLNETTAGARSAGFAIECVAWISALPLLTRHLSPEVWWALLNRLVEVACDPSLERAETVAAQLLGAELPLTLAYSFPEITSCHELAEAARQRLDLDLEQMLDGEGLLHCRYLQLLGPLFACWTRCLLLAGHVPGAEWAAETRRQYPGLVQHALRLRRLDGTPSLAPRGAGRWKRGLIETAVRLADEAEASRLDALLDRKQRVKTQPEEPVTSFEGEWAGIAVLRSDWRRKSPQLTVAYDHPQVATELTRGRDVLWSGNWSLDVSMNGERLSPTGNWEQVCWDSDGDIDYLELELDLAGQMTVQRHMLLSRKDHFLFLADALLAIQQGTIDYRSVLPSGGYTEFSPEGETREATLCRQDAKLARVLPIALPEWNVARSCGQLRSVPAGVEISQRGEGGAMFVPLWFDLSHSRLGRSLTWRQLTVAREREIEPRDVAVGYRVQIGRLQWLAYRSLATPAVRTVLGKNLIGEFFVGRFLSDGQVQTLLEIEP